MHIATAFYKEIVCVQHTVTYKLIEYINICEKSIKFNTAFGTGQIDGGISQITPTYDS